MPVKIRFTVVSSTGEDERYRATDLNYHGPTVKGWRSAQCCNYPQDITLQLHCPAILHRVQILAHQYLIPQKIEIWTCEDLEYDPSISPCGLQCFQYLGFITLSDNQATGFKSRELKSVTTPPTAARFVRLRLHDNHPNDRNVYNQVGLVAVSVLGEMISIRDGYGDEINNNGQFDSLPNSEVNLISNPQYTSPYDDLAFEMYVDKDVARIMRLMENKKHQAVIEERFEYARKLKSALQKLREAGEALGKYEQEKRQAINLEDYDKAKTKKNQIEKYRDQVYSSLHVEQLLELDGSLEENDTSIVKEPVQEEDEESCESPPELEVDVESPPQAFSPPQSSDQPRVTWSPQIQPKRRTSLTDFPSMRALAPSPNPLSHSFSHSSFPSSSSTHYLRQVDSILPQFQCYTPYTCHPSLNVANQPTSLDNLYQSLPLPPIRPQEPFYLKESAPEPEEKHVERSKSPNKAEIIKPVRGGKNSKKFDKNSFEAYEERMLPALRHPQLPGSDTVRECQMAVDQTRKCQLNEREKKQAALPITVFGMELVEKFYSKHFADKEEGLRLLQDGLKVHMNEKKPENGASAFSANKTARAAIFLLHRALRDKVFSVYSAAADSIRFFFHEFVPGRVSSAEVARSVEKLFPELLSKSGDVTPRIHNLAAHTLLSMVDCKHVRDLHIIPAHLSRPISSSVHPRLALSRLEMVEQLILNHGISTEKQSGLTCRTLAEFGASGLHHPAEAVRKVSERVLLQVYKVNPRIVRKQLPPDDDVTRRNLLYRQLFQEFDLMDTQKRKEQKEVPQAAKPTMLPLPSKDSNAWVSKETIQRTEIKRIDQVSQIPKRLVNQQTSPMNPNMPLEFDSDKTNGNENSKLRIIAPSKSLLPTTLTKKLNNEALNRRRNMSRISEESNDNEIIEETRQTIQHFPNLVDSVHITENRFNFAHKNNMKSIKYIFPTSYIGTSPKSQETLNNSNNQRKNPKDLKKNRNISGIPIPKNGFNSKARTSLNAVQKLIKPMKNEMTTSIYQPNSVENTSAVNENTADTNSSPSAVTPPSECDVQVSQIVEKEGKIFKRCIFCNAQEDWFTEENLNMHYWKNCPMLTRCTKCKEVVEISGLIQHRLDDCEHRKCFLKCDRCQEAIQKDEWDSHDCRCCSSGLTRLRCPMCHQDLATEFDWRDHLMGNNLCPNHPRKIS